MAEVSFEQLREYFAPGESLTEQKMVDLVDTLIGYARGLRGDSSGGTDPFSSVTQYTETRAFNALNALLSLGRQNGQLFPITESGADYNDLSVYLNNRGIFQAVLALRDWAQQNIIGVSPDEPTTALNTLGKISDALQNSAGTIPAIQTRIDNLEDRRPILDISKRWADTTSANPTAANGQIAIVNALIGNAQHTRPIDILEVHVSGEVGYSAHFLVQINSSSGNVLSAVVIPIYVNEVDGLSSNTISVYGGFQTTSSNTAFNLYINLETRHNSAITDAIDTNIRVTSLFKDNVTYINSTDDRRVELFTGGSILTLTNGGTFGGAVVNQLATINLHEGWIDGSNIIRDTIPASAIANNTITNDKLFHQSPVILADELFLSEGVVGLETQFNFDYPFNTNQELPDNSYNGAFASFIIEVSGEFDVSSLINTINVSQNPLVLPTTINGQSASLLRPHRFRITFYITTGAASGVSGNRLIIFISGARYGGVTSSLNNWFGITPRLNWTTNVGTDVSSAYSPTFLLKDSDPFYYGFSIRAGSPFSPLILPLTIYSNTSQVHTFAGVQPFPLGSGLIGTGNYNYSRVSITCEKCKFPLNLLQINRIFGRGVDTSNPIPTTTSRITESSRDVIAHNIRLPFTIPE